jgi:hypothetical protein
MALGIGGLLRVADAVVGLSDIARTFRRPTTGPQDLTAGGAGPIETRLAGLVVAALQEVFERDRARLELERAQMEAERQRAEEALRLERVRQAADRELGRLRVLAGIVLVVWFTSAFLGARLLGTAQRPPKLALALGWGVLLLALAALVAAYGRVSSSHAAEPGDSGELAIGIAGSLAPWLVIIGAGLTGASLLLALW